MSDRAPELEIIPVTPEAPREAPAPWDPSIVERVGRTGRAPRCDRHNRARCPRCA